MISLVRGLRTMRSMEDKSSKRRAIGIFGGLFAALAITLGMLLGQVPDAADHRAIVAALTPQTPPPQLERSFPEGDDYEATAPATDEAPVQVIEGDPQVIISKKP